MAKIATSVSLDKEVKEKAIELFSDLQLDMSTAVNLFLDQCLRHDGLPFQVTRAVSGNGAAAPEVVPLLHLGSWVMEEWLSKEEGLYFQHLGEIATKPADNEAAALHAVSFLQACFCAVAQKLPHTPGHFAWEVAIGVVDGITEDDEVAFNSLPARPSMQNYSLRIGTGDNALHIDLVGAVSSTLTRIDMVLEEKGLPALMNDDIFNVLERVSCWVDSIAYNMAEACLVVSRKVPDAMWEAIRSSLRTDCWTMAYEIYTMSSHKFWHMPVPEYTRAI